MVATKEDTKVNVGSASVHQRQAALFDELQEAGVHGDLLWKVRDQIYYERELATADAARLYFNEGRPITPTNFADLLSQMTMRSHGLLATLIGLREINDPDTIIGATQLLEDLTKYAKQVEDAFNAERWINRVEGK
jgi:hypothetical protein